MTARPDTGPAVLAVLVGFSMAAGLRADDPSSKLIAAARAQIGVTVVYDGSYRRLRYPGGDVPAERGVCTDVIVRAYRALGLDLQVAVHEDMSRAWQAYPRRWGLPEPDPNIDHRRVLNLATYFRRHGTVLEVASDPAQYRAGDLVTWRLPSGLPHIGLVSDRAGGARPMVIHNIGDGAAEEDILFRYPQTGHFRLIPGEGPALADSSPLPATNRDGPR